MNNPLRVYFYDHPAGSGFSIELLEKLDKVDEYRLRLAPAALQRQAGA